MFGLIPSFRWVVAAFASSALALITSAGWLRQVWISEAAVESAVAARDVEWRNKVSTATAQAKAAVVALNLAALQAAEKERSRLNAEDDRDARMAALEIELGRLQDDDPVVYPPELTKVLRK